MNIVNFFYYLSGFVIIYIPIFHKLYKEVQSGMKMKRKIISQILSDLWGTYSKTKMYLL